MSQIDELAQWIRHVNKNNCWHITEPHDWPGAEQKHQRVTETVSRLWREISDLPEVSTEYQAKAQTLVQHIPALLGEIIALRAMVQRYKIPAILALIHSEVSEALEAFRANDQAEFTVEMADTVIRVLDCIGAFESDFHRVLCEKIDANQQRGFRHGGKVV